MLQKIWLFATLLLVWLPAAAQKLPERNDGEEHGDAPYLIEDGWRALFNGKDFTGWHSQDGKPHEWITTSGVIWERLWGRRGYPRCLAPATGC